MLMVRLQVFLLIKERSSCPLNSNPLITQPSHLIRPSYSLTFSIQLAHISGSTSVLEVCFLTTHISYHCIQCVLLFFLYHLCQTTHIYPYLYLNLICLAHSHSFHLFIFLMTMFSPLSSLPHNIIIVLLILRKLSHT